ncbi:T9SS type A sorting domain-containing protein [Winogradskyella alexanderae]|uniref:T9SS type A sorting domain-containing protein n=1 Tax=Winogradskyella alexanderae TaxID=2877123 RepID=A0ABS7XR19_9FLAO|nr:T9SS type A sorting domain-containing protein [Winogradskyella alexanderae]MCA0132451.1 T9SS type A sorting domain-containing protein [Winogradskyella alexanderae]
MRHIYIFYFFLLSIVFGVNAQNTPNTISMNSADNNATAFGTNGTIATSVTTFYTHWDNTYIYIGWSEGNTNYSSDMYYVAFDTDPNTATGSSNSVENVSFETGGNLPDYYIVYENNDDFYGAPVSNGNAIELYNGTSGSWTFVSRTAGDDGTNSQIDFQNAPNGEVRIRIAWASLNFTRGNDKPLGITYWTNNEEGNFMWSRFPNSNPATGSTPITMTHQIVFNSTGDGINPSTSFYENALSSNTSYTSISDSNWNSTSTWQFGGIPLNGGDVSINNDVTSDINATVDNVTVFSSKSIIINNGVTLNLNNEMVLESTSTNYSSLIRNGSINGTVNYERFVNQIGTTGGSVGNDLIALPLLSFAFNFQQFLDIGSPTNRDVLATNPGNTLHAFGEYDNSNLVFNNLPTYLPTAPPDPGAKLLEQGIGYRAATTSGANLTFTGDVLNTNLDVTISTPTADIDSQWNLMGNPFPSYLDASIFLSVNSGPMEDSAEAIYAYNSGTYSGGAATTANNYTIINAATISMFSGENFNIAPGQGFFVPAEPTQGFSGTITFDATTNDMRTTSGVDDYIVGRTSIPGYTYKLGLTKSTETITTFFFMDGATRGLDQGYDAGTFGESNLYSHLVEGNTGRNMALQALALSDVSDVIIPLGVDSNIGEQVTFNTAFSSIPETINVFLDDTVANTSTLLNANDYVLTPTVNLNGTGRFFLRFTDSALSSIENSITDYKIIADYSGDSIIVSGLFDNSVEANIYDIHGRLMSKSKLNSNTQIQSISTAQLTTGVYIVEVKNDRVNLTKKVIVH